MPPRGAGCGPIGPEQVGCGFPQFSKEKLRFIRGVAMTGTLATGAFAAIGGPIAAIVLLASSPAARADELTDLRASQEHLRANQELLQKRIDQLSQAPPPGAPGVYVPGFGAETRPPGAPVTTGSFPRSFLIPGTDTSLRIGGYGNARVIYWIKGAAVGGQLNGQG